MLQLEALRPMLPNLLRLRKKGCSLVSRCLYREAEHNHHGAKMC